MKKNMIRVCVCTVLIGTALSSQAADLLTVYRQALKSDPSFKKAEANWMAAKENLPIALSGQGVPGQGVLPQIDVTGQIFKNFQNVKSAGQKARGDFTSSQYQITLTQPIFNVKAWYQIGAANFQVKAATATYLFNIQDLIQRTALQYFEVLRAYSTLQNTIAQTKSFLQQLITTEQKYKVGLIAITNVYDAKASYDESIAQEIADSHALEIQIENLRAITGVNYQKLNGLNEKIPLMMPAPNNISQWVSTANQQNYNLQAANYSAKQQYESVKAFAAGGLPTINGVVQYGETQSPTLSPNSTGPDLGSNIHSSTGSVGATLNFPVFQGGYVYASTKQAHYNYLAAKDQLETTQRDVTNKTRQSFLGIESSISQIKAQQQAIISTKAQLKATEASYTVGTRTMVEVLEAITSLAQAQQNYNDARYNYVEEILKLKEQAGTLSPSDLVQINRWLGATKKFSPYTQGFKIKPYKLDSLPKTQPIPSKQVRV